MRWKLGFLAAGALTVALVGIPIAVAESGVDDGGPPSYLRNTVREGPRVQDDPEIPARLQTPLDNGRVGWIDKEATFPPIVAGMSLEETKAALAEYQRHHFPVTAERDRASIVIGYVVPALGFALSTQTMNAPGFDLDARVAEVDAVRDRYRRKIEASLPGA